MTGRHSSADAGRRGIVVVGDALVDLLEHDDGASTRHPGGAGLNVAVGVARLGARSLLACPLAEDEPGRWLAATLRAESVEVVPLPGIATSGVATSRRVDGEPVYDFSPGILDRHYTYPSSAVRRIVTAAVLTVNSFPMDDLDQVDRLVALARAGSLTMVVDPNARPTLLRRVESYRAGFLRLAASSAVVKLSRQDIELLFAGADHRDVVRQILAVGPVAVVVTAGSDGAEVHTAEGTVSVPVPRVPAPVVDTLGAGDAVLARLLVEVEARGVPRGPSLWHDVLTDAMYVAATVCRVAGGIPPADLNNRGEHHGSSSRRAE